MQGLPRKEAREEEVGACQTRITKETAMRSELGKTYKDRVSGFTGVATGYVEYITGCHQLLLVPEAGDDGTLKSNWFDVDRVKEVVAVPRVELPAQLARPAQPARPGADVPAPIR